MRRSTMARAAMACALVAGLVGIAGAGPGSPATAGGGLQYWEGTVTGVSDGDTIWVDVAGDGKGPVEVRNAGIQATEIAHPKNGSPDDECHSREAMARMKELVFGANRHVRLSAQDASSRAGSRLLRFVDVRVGGAWVDVQEVLLREGFVWWKPNTAEPAHNSDYRLPAAQAMQDGLRIYDPDYRLGPCETGPRQGTPIRMTLQYNGFHPVNGGSINGEWVKVENLGTENLPLKGWSIRLSGHSEPFRFPKWATVKAGSSVKLRAGSGSDGGSTFYWGRPDRPFPDPERGLDYPGRTVYLLDPDGDIRAFFGYPCIVSCTDPLDGAVVISEVQWDAPGDDARNPNGEYVEITARTGVDLGGYVVERFPYNKVLPKGTTLAAGQKLRVHMGQGGNDLGGSVLKVHLGADHGILSNSGQSVVLRTLADVWLDCDAWGSGRC